MHPTAISIPTMTHLWLIRTDLTAIPTMHGISQVQSTDNSILMILNIDYSNHLSYFTVSDADCRRAVIQNYLIFLIKLDNLLPQLQGKAGDFVFTQVTKQTLSNYNELVKELNSRFRVVETEKTFAAKFS